MPDGASGSAEREQLAHGPVPAGELRLPADRAAGPDHHRRRRPVRLAAAGSAGLRSPCCWRCCCCARSGCSRRTYLPRRGPAAARRTRRRPGSSPAIVSWAGMRGVVTLAAVFVLPEALQHREVLVLVAMVVVGGTLLLQGSTLPWLVRRLRGEGPDPREDALQQASVLQSAVARACEALDECPTTTPRRRRSTRCAAGSSSRADAAWERLGRRAAEETPSQTYRRLRLAMLRRRARGACSSSATPGKRPRGARAGDGRAGPGGVHARPRRARAGRLPGRACCCRPSRRRRVRAPAPAPARSAADAARLPGLRREGTTPGASADVPVLRQRRLLRLLARQSRRPALRTTPATR